MVTAGYRAAPFQGWSVSPYTPCAARLKTLIPATALREHEKATPHRARIASLPGTESATNRDRKARLIPIPRSLMIESFLTTGTVGDGRRPSLMELAMFLVSLAQLVVDIIALIILIRRK